MLNFLGTPIDYVPDQPYVSLNSIVGSKHSKCMRLRVLIHNQVVLQLIDSGSSHTFVSELAASRLQCAMVDIESMALKVANGHNIQCSKLV